MLGSQYDILEMVEKEVCPTADSTKSRSSRDVWQDTSGIDVLTVSNGDEFAYKEKVVPGKFTIFDFGASWCGPCYIAAQRLRVELETHTDIAVRAISLGDDPNTSFDLPVARQHLAFAPGLPWFVVYAPTGKKIYEGGNVEKALSKISKSR